MLVRLRGREGQFLHARLNVAFRVLAGRVSQIAKILGRCTYVATRFFVISTRFGPLDSAAQVGNTLVVA